MKMSLYKTEPGKTKRGKLCWIEINKTEALALIKSLISQLQGGPNHERLESRCSGGATNLSVVVVEEEEEA